MRLFIIGNGFDLDHGLESSFFDFKSFLEENYLPVFNRMYPVFPNVGEGKDGELVINPNDSAQILYHLIDTISDSDDWSDFEKCLGEFDYHYILDLVEKDDINPFHYYYNLEDMVSGLNTSLLYSVSELFSEWVQQIDLSNALKKYAFRSSDLFLTFNYTYLLEEIYDINPSNICHIHGCLKDGVCITGHNNKERLFDDYDDLISFPIENIHNSLIKDTVGLYHLHLHFFKRVFDSDIDEIIIFGFSISDVDSYYLTQLFNNIDTTGIRLYLSPYEATHKSDLMIKALKSLGFKGAYGGSFN